MARKERFDGCAIARKLSLQSLQDARAALREQTLGGDLRRGAAELFCAGKDFQPLGCRVRPPEPGGAEEPIRLRSGQAFSHLRLPAPCSFRGVGKLSMKRQVQGLVQSSKAYSAAG